MQRNLGSIAAQVHIENVIMNILPLPSNTAAIGQVHRKSSSIRSSRSFPIDRSSRNVSKAAAEEGAMDGSYSEGPVGRVVWLLTQSYSVYFGFNIGAMVYGDVVADLLDKEEKSREAFAKDAEAHALAMGRIRKV
ncbi:unnamed protein product [Microthlaspi erraticum]|uniref:Uncharacterized protein n=1 Tax=Microthlaspi erraticum TaxID=1685480 RepID=A0A6D2HPF4_9BRAS|nr:unnamed protein product [Microthlaspi erraticum]